MQGDSAVLALKTRMEVDRRVFKTPSRSPFRAACTVLSMWTPMTRGGH